MAWTCTLYSGFHKRVNSTKQPSGGTTYDCRIKNDTDFKNPVLEVAAADLSGVNYMLFNGEYFYVTSLIPHRTGVWEIAGQRDPLATYKAAIGSTYAFQLYGGGTAVDDDTRRVPDERLAVSRVPQHFSDSVAIQGSQVVFSPRGGTFILSAVGDTGGVASFAIGSGAMAGLLNTIGQDAQNMIRTAFYTPVAPTDETEVLTHIRNGLADSIAETLAFGNCIQAIRDCHWVPFLAASGTGAEVMLGDFHTGVYGLRLTETDLVVNDTFNIDIPWPVNDWKRNLCQIQIALPLCGIIPIPVDKFNDKVTLQVNVALDYLGGNLSYEIRAGVDIIAQSGANCAVPYAIGSSNVSVQNFISGALQAVGGGIQAAGGAISAGMSMGIFGIDSLAGGITSMAQGAITAITPQIQSTGSLGGCSAVALNNAIILSGMYFPPIDEAATQASYGHPVFSLQQPTAGYNLFRAFSVDCGGTPDEIARINSFFNTGAYYE